MSLSTAPSDQNLQSHLKKLDTPGSTSLQLTKSVVGWHGDGQDGGGGSKLPEAAGRGGEDDGVGLRGEERSAEASAYAWPRTSVRSASQSRARAARSVGGSEERVYESGERWCLVVRAGEEGGGGGGEGLGCSIAGEGGKPTRCVWRCGLWLGLFELGSFLLVLLAVLVDWA